MGVFNVLIQHCCNTWLPSDPYNLTDTVFQSVLNHLDILTEACTYGPVYRRDQRYLPVLSIKLTSDLTVALTKLETSVVVYCYSEFIAVVVLVDSFRRFKPMWSSSGKSFHQMQ